MAAGVQIDDEVVKASLRRLLELADQTSKLRQDFQRASELQNGTWPQIDSVQEFRARYQGALDQVGAQFLHAQEELNRFHEALRGSITALQQQDAEIAFQLQQLAERLDTAPAVPTPQAATPAAKNLGF